MLESLFSVQGTLIDYLRNFSKIYQEDTVEGSMQLLRAVAAGVFLNRTTEEVEILWKKSFSFLLNKELVAEVAPNENGEQELSIQKFKGTDAGRHGWFSNHEIEEMLFKERLIDFVIWFREAERSILFL